eukprot:jgi/Hompol1/6625/HPOL_001903-RA
MSARPEVAGPETVQAPYPVRLRGHVTKGFGRANLPEDVAELAGKVMETGIYYGWASVGSDATVRPMVMSFGWNPFYKNEKRSAEVHIIHKFEEDFYGVELRLSFEHAGFQTTAHRRLASTQDMGGNSSASDSMTLKANEWFELGVDKWNKEDYLGAQDAFEKSIWTRPTSDAHFNLGNVFHSQGKHDKALEQWKQSIDLSPRADAHVNMANVLALIKRDLATAIPHYKAAIELSPEDGEIHYNFGVVLDASSRLEEAVDHYQQARKLGVEQAEKNLRNALAKLIGAKAKEQEAGSTNKN